MASQKRLRASPIGCPIEIGGEAGSDDHRSGQWRRPFQAGARKCPGGQNMGKGFHVYLYFATAGGTTSVSARGAMRNSTGRAARRSAATCPGIGFSLLPWQAAQRLAVHLRVNGFAFTRGAPY